MLPIHPTVQQRLDTFYETKKIPHLLFHGASGTGKKHLVHDFLCRIYENDKAKMKLNIMFVNCAHGKGIKFIREELKMFAKSNSRGVLFKTIVLLNADQLTTDAQSALRRCIEQFSGNTRFFIIVENKNKLLDPILSRFCEIYVPEYIVDGEIKNLHQLALSKKFARENRRMEELNRLIDEWKGQISPQTISNLLEDCKHADLVILSVRMYDAGFSTIDLMNWMEKQDNIDARIKTSANLCFHKIRAEYRCERLLLLYMMDFIWIRNEEQRDISKIGFL